jgi:hypothetical protein
MSLNWHPIVSPNMLNASDTISLMIPEIVFKTLNFLFNLRMGPVSYIVALPGSERLANDKHSILLGLFISNGENEVL